MNASQNLKKIRTIDAVAYLLLFQPSAVLIVLKINKPKKDINLGKVKAHETYTFESIDALVMQKNASIFMISNIKRSVRSS